MNGLLLFFNVTVWGTVSDWIMIFVTAITAGFILSTLRSQMKVQKLQENTSHIENERFRFEIMPSFEIKCETNNGSEKETGIDIYLYFELKLIANPAKNIQVSFNQNLCGLILQEGANTSKIFMNVGTNLLFDGHFHSAKNPSRADNFHKIFWDCPLSIKVEFEDINNNKYEQFLVGDLNALETNLKAYQPVFISNLGIRSDN